MKNFYLAGSKPKRLVSLMLVAASLGLGTRLITEHTVQVIMPRSRACLCRVRPWPQYGNDDLVRGVAKTRAREQF